MMITTIISDIMGVLLLKDPHWQEDVYWEKRLGLPPGSLISALFGNAMDQAAILGYVSQREVFQRACQTLGLAQGSLTEFEEALSAGRLFNLELAHFLHSLRPRYKTALLSNAWSQARHDFDRLFQLNMFVDLQIFSAEEKLAKPDERLYLLALARLRVQPEEVVFLDDRLENVQVAQHMGMHAILFEENGQAIAALQRVVEQV
jgi:epoxide hydrolase-like predicted phosphatase